jgi:AAA domain
MSGPIDFERINAAALRNGRALLQQLIPGGTFRSLEYIVRNPRRDDKHLGSFKINYRSGQWADFAIDNKSARGGDIISCYAYARDLDQSEAARQIAEKLSIPPYKGSGADVGAPAKSNSSSRVISKPSDNDRIDTAPQAPSWERAADYSLWGEEGPPREQAEIRRHYYASDGLPKQKVKIKLKSEPKDKWVTWYRIFRHGVPIGWQAKKPNDYIAMPYVATVLNPFDSELKADDLLWPEGEKDVDTLSGLSLPAFTFGGVGDGLPDGIGTYLKDRSLVILADNDDPGREHAEKKAAMAHGSGAASIRLVHFPELPPKGDISDFITNGGTAKQLAERIDRSPRWSPAPKAAVVSLEPVLGKTSELVSLATIKPEATDWLWHLRIPRGAQTISTGWPGVGKSQQQCYIVARASTGTPWPDGSPCPCGDSIMLTCEDSYAKTVVPRLLAAGANLERVHALPIIRTDAKTKRAFLLTEDLDELERHLLCCACGGRWCGFNAEGLRGTGHQPWRMGGLEPGRLSLSGLCCACGGRWCGFNAEGLRGDRPPALAHGRPRQGGWRPERSNQ